MKRATYIPYICQHCRKEFYPSSTGRTPKYCSNSCRQSTYRMHRDNKRGLEIINRAKELFRNKGMGQEEKL